MDRNSHLLLALKYQWIHMRLNASHVDQFFETLGTMPISSNAGKTWRVAIQKEKCLPPRARMSLLDADKPKLTKNEKDLTRFIMARLSAALDNLPQTVSDKLVLARANAVANRRKLT